jgi:hypothetical protein
MINLLSRNAGRTIAAGLAVLVLAANPAEAQDKRSHGQGGHRGYSQHGGGYGHGVVVPPGYRVRALPPHYDRVVVHRDNYYYHGGMFYRPYPYYPNYVVVGAPIGARVGWLPPGYVSIGIGGYPYAYFNSTWYLWDEPRRDYIVVEKPAGADEALANAPGYAASAAELYVYPARGQSEEQTRRDRYECHLWAVDQTQSDPSTGSADAAQSGEYRRAITACLDGRGYTVR